MAIGTKIVSSYLLADRDKIAHPDLPALPVQGNYGSIPSFPARGPRGVVTVYVGHRGTLWRMGDPRIDRFDGQIAVCQPYQEVRWIGVNAMPPYRLSTMWWYIDTYRYSHNISHINYLVARMKQLEPQFGTDIMAIEAGKYDASFSEELREMIEWIHDRASFLRKLVEDNPHNNHLWPSFYGIHNQINSYLVKQEQWVAMQNRPEPEYAVLEGCTIGVKYFDRPSNGEQLKEQEPPTPTENEELHVK